jgi:acetyl-CoA carboxylase biotin carboxyl carrier protein
MHLPTETLDKLIDVMEHHQIAELTVEWEQNRIHLERAISSGEPMPAVAVTKPVPSVELPPAGTPIESPMTGMFYRGPSPSEPPYLQEGDAIQEGQIIGLIEAMKVFNEVPSPMSGIVMKIVAQNATLIQVGDVIMLVEPQPSA